MRERLVSSSVGAALEQCVADAACEWLEANKAGRQAEYAWSTDVLTTHLNVQFYAGGRINVEVSILCKKEFNSQLTMFYLQKRGKHEVIRLRDSLKLNVS